MCGICGIVRPKSARETVEEALLVRMRDTMAHRGPDGAGTYLDGRVGFGHRRLSIVDVEGGHQPMSNEDGTVWVTYNGEIYNHADIRPMLEERGHTYVTSSDTETLVHLYEEEGEAMVDRLRGMFAFGIWDAGRERLLLVRDRLGVKPLYYVHAADGSLFFASEIKALVEAGAVRAELDPEALPDHLANHATSDDRTLFAGVRRLPPGHLLVWKEGHVTIRRYWDVSFEPAEAHRGTDDELVGRWRELFEQSVRLRLMADVPLGMFLSGGIDSSAIAAVMTKLVREPIKTFSVAFDDRGANELEYARMVARALGTDHREVVVTPEQFFGALPRLVWHEDEPIAHAASVPLYFVSELAAQHVKVVLTGEGSDELLAGYYRYRKTLANLAFGGFYHGVAPEALRDVVRRMVDALPAGRARAKLSRTPLALGPGIDNLYFDNFAVFPRAMQARLLTPAMRERAGETDPYAGMRRLLDGTDAKSTLNRLLYADLKTYLHELLMKQDQMSMAASIESRVPFLDHRLVEFSAGLPDRLKLHNGWTTKYVLRRAMRGVLPEQILTRPKMGFPVPLGAWFRGPYRGLVEGYVLSERAHARGVFAREEVERIVAEHVSGARDHSERIWALMNFEIWMRRFIDGEELGASQAAAA